LPSSIRTELKAPVPQKKKKKKKKNKVNSSPFGGAQVEIISPTSTSTLISSATLLMPFGFEEDKFGITSKREKQLLF
jgi:hypothetical protein